MNKPLPFAQKDSKTREHHILSWFVEAPNVGKATRGVILTEDTIKNISSISAACLNANVDINKCRRYFDNDGWAKILCKDFTRIRGKMTSPVTHARSTYKGIMKPLPLFVTVAVNEVI